MKNVKILVCYDENLINEAREVLYKLSTLGFIVTLDNPIRNTSSDDTIDSSFDMVVSVGGDGTMLKASQKAISKDKPIFGINAGRVGFLTAFDFSEIDTLTDLDIFSLTATKRMLLEVIIDDNHEKKYLTLNDVVVSRNGISKTIELKVFGDNSLIGEYRGDGIIISTPTGSTGYSLSAGGPIVDPLLDVILVTPICAHSLFSRSIALDSNKRVKVEISSRKDTDVYVSLDSTHMIKPAEGFSISVYKSEKTLRLLSSKKKDYYEVLSKKIGSNY